MYWLSLHRTTHNALNRKDRHTTEGRRELKHAHTPYVFNTVKAVMIEKHHNESHVTCTTTAEKRQKTTCMHYKKEANKEIIHTSKCESTKKK
jgi:hypothetical protein